MNGEDMQQDDQEQEQERARDFQAAQRATALKEKAAQAKKTVETAKKVVMTIRSLGTIISFIIATWPVWLTIIIVIIIIMIVAWIFQSPAESAKTLGSVFQPIADSLGDDIGKKFQEGLK